MRFSHLYFSAMALVFGVFGFRGSVGHSLWVLGFLLLLGPGLYPRMRAALARLRKAPRFRDAFLLAGIPMALLCLSNGRNLSSTDNMSVQLTAASLIEFGTPEFSALLGYPHPSATDCTVKRGYYTVCGEQGLYSGTSPGMLLFAVPSFALAKLAGADLRQTEALWRLGKWTASWLAAAILTLFLVLALRVGSFSGALVATVFLGTGSALWSVIGQGLWSHGGVCLALLAALWFALHSKDAFENGLGIGAAWGVMFACRVTAAPLIMVFAVWLVLTRRRAFAGAATGGLFSLGILALYSYALYGHPLGPQYLGAASADRVIFSFAYFPSAFPGLLLSPGTGLLIYQPWLLLLFAGIVWKDWVGACLALFASQLLLFAGFVDWHGQWCWGTRYLAESIPLLALVLVPTLSAHWTKRSFRRAAYALGALAFLIHLNGTRPGGGKWSEDPRPQDREKPMSERVWDWTDPAFAYPVTR